MTSSSYDRAKDKVEANARILAVFIVNSTGKIPDLFRAEDANINRSFIEAIRTALDIKFEGKKIIMGDQPLGQHPWDIIEYDKVRAIKQIHENLQ